MVKRVIVGDVIGDFCVVVSDTGEVAVAKERGDIRVLRKMIYDVTKKLWLEGSVVFVPEEISAEVGGAPLWEMTEHEVFKIGEEEISPLTELRDIFFSGGIAPVEGLLVGRYQGGVVDLVDYCNTTDVRWRNGRMFVDRLIAWYNNSNDCGCYTGREILRLYGKDKKEFEKILEKVSEEDKEVVRALRARVVMFGV